MHSINEEIASRQAFIKNILEQNNIVLGTTLGEAAFCISPFFLHKKLLEKFDMMAEDEIKKIKNYESYPEHFPFDFTPIMSQILNLDPLDQFLKNPSWLTNYNVALFEPHTKLDFFCHTLNTVASLWQEIFSSPFVDYGDERTNKFWNSTFGKIYWLYFWIVNYNKAGDYYEVIVKDPYAARLIRDYQWLAGRNYRGRLDELLACQTIGEISSILYDMRYSTNII